MATIIAIGEPANDDERAVIALLRDEAPDTWTVVHNLELIDSADRHRYEVDLVVIAPHAVYVIDVKGTRGRIRVAGNRWYPAGRQPFQSPLPKLRHHARKIKDLLAGSDPGLRRLYVGQLVVLFDPNAQLQDPDRRDVDEVCHVADLRRRLVDRAAVPSRFDAQSGIGRDPRLVARLTGNARPPTGEGRFGNWEVIERLAEHDDGAVEYRARNASLPGTGPRVRLKVFPLDPYLPELDRIRQRHELGNAYRTLHRLPGHPHVLTYHDFFVDDTDQRAVLVFDDIAGTSLELRLADDDPLTRDEAMRILRGVVFGLVHAHRHRVTHRALGPGTVVLAVDGRAVVTGFDHARESGPREFSVVNQLPDVVDERYVAPEGNADVAELSSASDVYALGVLGYRLLTGELPFADGADQRRQRSVLPREPLNSADVPREIVNWLDWLCALNPADRPSAVEAVQALARATRRPPPAPSPSGSGGGEPPDDDRERWRNLSPNDRITANLVVRSKLGSGSFGVVYQVHNMLARTDQVVKIILTDPENLEERLRQEYGPLLALPQHPSVVRVHHGDLVPGTRFPFLVFEYVPGADVAKVLASGPLALPDVRRLGVAAAAGLAHIHGNHVFHCDIKPANLLWTDQGAKLIDFNVAVSLDHVLAAAGSARYLPPDYSAHDPDLVDRDVYALGLTLYEALTGGDWPWDDHRRAQPGVEPRDPRAFTRLTDLAPGFVEVLLRAIRPNRPDRYPDAAAFRRALEQVRQLRVPPRTADPMPAGTPEAVDNPFVAHLQTLYSQSSTTNVGTRGLDPHQHMVYVETLLDRELIPDVLAGEHRVVIITGNAGDGKTAFLEKLVAAARELGATVSPPRPNGADFVLDGRWFRTNLDGSQDEGDRGNDQVLAEFFAPFVGVDDAGWPTQETRLIAINEGRLVDFLRTHEQRFPALQSAVLRGLAGTGTSSAEANAVTLVNLNARSVVAGGSEAIFDGFVRELTNDRHWADCTGCALAERCYVLHNVRTLAHPDAGERITGRLRELYTVAHLRGRLHITLRDLRSALAYTLTSGRGCADIRELYRRGDTMEILSGFYFQSWRGPRDGRDRLLALLRESDISELADPALDRALDFSGPDASAAFAELDGRGDYDAKLLEQLFRTLPRGGAVDAEVIAAHREYVAAARRRYFFESPDAQRWRRMLPQRSVAEFRELLGDENIAALAVDALIHAINRSEGLVDPTLLGEALALAVRKVRGGSIRSYRVFPLDRFSVKRAGPPSSRYLETEPDHLRLRYVDPEAPGSVPIEIPIRLGLFDMLWRLGRGGIPASADRQGQHLSLTIFKNMLGSAPYQSLLLTVTGHDVHTVARRHDGLLMLQRSGRQAGEPQEVP